MEEEKWKVEGMELVDLVVLFILITIIATSGEKDVLGGSLTSSITWVRQVICVLMIVVSDTLFLVVQQPL